MHINSVGNMPKINFGWIGFSDKPKHYYPDDKVSIMGFDPATGATKVHVEAVDGDFDKFVREDEDDIKKLIKNKKQGIPIELTVAGSEEQA